jgi:hypothetical protein
MSLNIRLASKYDVEAMTKLHLSSFSPDEHLGALLGPAFVRASYLWHVTDECAYVIIAEMDGKLLGLLGMCDGSFTMRMIRGCWQAFLGALIRRPLLLIDRRLWSRITRTQAHSEWVNEFCSTSGVAQMTIGAVDVGARGHNVFPSLIRSCEKISKERGIVAVRAGLYRRNAPCQRAFVKSGWVEFPELGSAETIYFVFVSNSELLKRFPYLTAREVIDHEK